MERLAAQSDREWILVGLAESCAERGYKGTTVVDICDAAGVSRAAFDELFASKEECLVAAVESLLAEARHRIDAGYSPAASWESTLRAGVAALLDLFAERPALARTALIETPVAGGVAAELCASARAEALSYVERGRQLAVESGIPASAGRAALAGVETLLLGKVLARKTEELRSLGPEIVHLLAVPYLGQDAAQRAAADRVPARHLRAVA